MPLYRQVRWYIMDKGNRTDMAKAMLAQLKAMRQVNLARINGGTA